MGRMSSRIMRSIWRGDNPSGFPRWAYILLSVLAAGFSYFFSIGLNGFGPLVWIAPIPILILAFNAQPRPTAIIAFGTFLIGSLTLFSYLVKLMPFGVVIVSLVIPAIAFTLAILATRYTALQINPWVAIAVFPSVWTSYEYLASIFSPNGTAGSLAYTQTGFLPLIQLVSLTGIWGITFLLTLVPAGFAIAWHLRKNKRLSILASGVPVVLVLSVIVYGSIRIHQTDQGQSMRVGLTATDTTIRYFRTEKSEEALPVVQAYARRIDQLAAQGTELIVLPEKFVGVTPSYSGNVYKILGAAARDHRVVVVAGLNMIDRKSSRNVAVVFSSEGQVLTEYSKIHLVPGFEDRYQPGTKPVEFSVSGMTIGLAICKDMDFPDLLSQYSRGGVGIVVVPAWDFGQDGQWHSRMAMTRGIEGGFAVVRSAQDGQLSIIDHLGRIIAEDRSSRAQDVLLVGNVRSGPGRTFYSLSGDWVAWLSLFFLAGVFAIATFRKFQKKR
jgi:apolipoprotein N-acyltransferase